MSDLEQFVNDFDKNRTNAYVVGQFQDHGFVVNRVDFNRNVVTFCKDKQS